MKNLFTWACVVVLLLASASPAWAQRKKSKFTPPDTQSYMLPYIITVAVVLGGVSVVCMPTKRKRDVDVTKEDEH